ncbi:MAG: DUF4290 domain-containing protein [Bacteroidales bacterium]|nr:DUF4290 domain-containing protein [Bacteroidales bacterium]
MKDTVNLQYNTEREPLAMPEYGRGVLAMAEYLQTIPDRAKRSEQARAVVKTMEILNPQVRQQENWERKLWDHLYMIAGYNLDIDSPWPAPVKEEMETKPVPLPMKGSPIKAMHYGRNIERIIDLICEQPEGETKTALIRNLAIYMRTQYLIWNKDSVADATIFSDIEKLSGGRIHVPEGIELGKVSQDAVFARPGQGQQGGGKKNRNRKYRKNKGK